MVVLVLIFGIITVSSRPSGAFESLWFYILDQDFRQPLGEELAAAIAALPMWFQGTIQVIRLINRHIMECNSNVTPFH